MQPAGCKTAIWFIYHQEALANQIRCTLKEGREGGGGGCTQGSNHGWQEVVTLDGSCFKCIPVKLVLCMKGVWGAHVSIMYSSV